MQTASAANAEDLKRLTIRQQHIAPIAALTATGDIVSLKTEFEKSLDAGLTVNEVKEVLIQMYAYAGFPRSLNGINSFIEVLKSRREKGISDAPGKDASPMPEGMDSNAYGNKVRNELANVDLTNNAAEYAKFAPVIDDFLKAHLFGDIFARDILTYQDREVATISALAAMDGTEAQLASHIKMGRNTGLVDQQFMELARILEDRVSHVSAQKILKEVGAPIPEDGELKVNRYDKDKAVQGPKEYFTGKVMVSSPFASGEINSYSGAVVNFEAGARTAWHTHPLGQTLIVVSGKGRVQKLGEPVQEILPGDVVWIPAGEKHWHGAAPDSAMSHVAISDAKNGRVVDWMEHVTDAEYLSAR